MSRDSSRRDFLKTTAVTGSALAAGWSAAANVHAGGTGQVIRVGLIGCGGRGTGAAEQCLNADSNVRLVAVGDAFRDRANACLQTLRNNNAIAGRVNVDNELIFTGLDAYRQVIPACDLVVLATPPGFRPIHIAAAVAARKHIFTEKPVAVDGPGVRACLRAYLDAKQHNLAIVAGTQRRYQTGYRESMRRIHDGAIGQITSARCYWNQGGLWHADRAGRGDVEWQIRNWLYFCWLSGDHICEQHVHNIDVINWALSPDGTSTVPLRCTALGGRAARTQPHFGHIFDHFACDFEYPGGVHVMSQCRQIDGCPGKITESVSGTRGTWGSPSREEDRPGYVMTGPNAWAFQARNDNQPYQEEHIQLIRSIREGRPINDLKNVAQSTLTAIMGRMAAYSGQVVTSHQALNSRLSLMPANLSFEMKLPEPAVAVPGHTRAF